MANPQPIGERDLWACAPQVIALHGRGARRNAARCAVGLLEGGDIVGRRAWTAVLARINAWRRQPLPLQ